MLKEHGILRVLNQPLAHVIQHPFHGELVLAETLSGSAPGEGLCVCFGGLVKRLWALAQYQYVSPFIDAMGDQSDGELVLIYKTRSFLSLGSFTLLVPVSSVMNPF